MTFSYQVIRCDGFARRRVITLSAARGRIGDGLGISWSDDQEVDGLVAKAESHQGVGV